mmetsp:Transcript_6607/g.16479  ORF Transcript_6607/g.16479 Transcript_6607/m.16479 type:complete len:223 (-) Transcript_6607:1147-1815(-)
MSSLSNFFCSEKSSSVATDISFCFLAAINFASKSATGEGPGLGSISIETTGRSVGASGCCVNCCGDSCFLAVAIAVAFAFAFASGCDFVRTGDPCALAITVALVASELFAAGCAGKDASRVKREMTWSWTAATLEVPDVAEATVTSGLTFPLRFCSSRSATTRCSTEQISSCWLLLTSASPLPACSGGSGVSAATIIAGASLRAPEKAYRMSSADSGDVAML